MLNSPYKKWKWTWINMSYFDKIYLWHNWLNIHLENKTQSLCRHAYRLWPAVNQTTTFDWSERFLHCAIGRSYEAMLNTLYQLYKVDSFLCSGILRFLSRKGCNIQCQSRNYYQVSIHLLSKWVSFSPFIRLSWYIQLAKLIEPHRPICPIPKGTAGSPSATLLVVE